MIVLDTHAWIWWVSDRSKLSEPARARIEQATDIGICAVSCWEVAMLVSKERIRFDRDVLTWIHQALQQPRVRLVPLMPEIAVAATRLAAGLPGDPADRMIVASALRLDADLVTRDRALQTFGNVRTVW